MKLKITLAIFVLTTQLFAQKWTSTLPQNPEEIFKSAIVYGYLNETIFASGNDGVQYYNNFIFSTDKGNSWSSPTPIFTDTSNKEQVVQFLGVKDRMYAAVNSNLGYKYYYSTDNGSTWVLDSDGLPGKYTASTATEYKGAFTLAKLSEDYIVAYNNVYLHDAFYKKIGDATWTPMTTYLGGKTHTAFTSIGNTWYALNQGYTTTPNEKITKSTDFGVTWQQISKSGLPADFEGGFLVSNNQNKLFYGAGTTDANTTDIYVSEDEGATWVKTNAGQLGDVAGELNYITNIYANNDNVVATYYFPGFEQAPRYLYSNTKNVNFKQGNVSGIVGGGPFVGRCFFDINGQFYSIHRYILYSNNSGTLNTQTFNATRQLTFYPNPAINKIIYINAEDSFSWQLYTVSGSLIKQGVYKKGVFNTSKINLENICKGVYLLKTNIGVSKKVVVQ